MNRTMYIRDVDEDLLVDSLQRWFQGLENLSNMEVFLSYFVKYEESLYSSSTVFEFYFCKFQI